MEKDNKTRIYGINLVEHSRQPRIWEQYPGYNESGKIFHDNEAKAILNRTDFYGMPDPNNYGRINGERNHAIQMWQLQNTPLTKKDDTPFSISTMEPGSKKQRRKRSLAKIVKDLEERSGTKGLTIVCQGI